MRKITIAVLAVLLTAVLAFAGYGLYDYQTTTADAIPYPAVIVMDEDLQSYDTEWHAAVLKGLFYKDLSLPPGGNDAGGATDLGRIGQEPVTVETILPEDFANTLLLTQEGDTVYRGDASDWQGTLNAGTYSLEITCTSAEDERTDGYGSFTYRCTFSIEAEPALLVGKQELLQGDILSLKLIHLLQETAPQAETELGLSIFTPVGEHEWQTEIPIGNTRPAGTYTVTIQGDGRSFETEVTVLPYEFPRENLVIDTSDPAIAEASSVAANIEFNKKLTPLRSGFETERYWSGKFEHPVDGRVSTIFGTIRFTNGDYSRSRSHYGMDIAVPEGTPVAAPNAGHVLFAEYLLLTGNTVVIEHGGGLRSYYYHMSRIDVTADDMVTQGTILGAVGSTGYSTGPHLHYEIRIGDQAVSPSMLFEEDAGLYSLEPAA